MSRSTELTAEAFNLLQNALEESEVQVEELRQELRRKRPTKNGLEKRLDVIKHRLERSEEDRDRWKTEAGQLEELVDNANAKLDKLKDKLKIAESGPERLTKQEINYWRARAESFDQVAADYKTRIRSLRQDVKARDEELSEVRSAASADEANTRISESQADELDAATARAKTYEQQVAVLNATQIQSDADQASLKAELGAALSQRDQAQERLAQISTTAATVNKRLAERDTELQELNAQRTLLESEIGRLQEALREEKECAENLGEIVNERLDQLNKSRELHEEMEERYEESEWRLGKAGHFERLVKRRKSLISSLLAAIRAKSKANVALKAGLDSLRRFKVKAQESEQKLLEEIDQLKAAIGEARETIKRHQDTTLTQNKVSESQGRVEELEGRVKSQAEVINSLEDEIKLSKVVQNDLSIKTAEAQTELTQRQRALAMASTGSLVDQESDRLMIDALERELAELRTQLQARTDTTEKSAGADEDGDKELNARLEQSEAKIKELTEEADSWKRKYEFLSTDAPAAYQTQAAAEK